MTLDYHLHNMYWEDVLRKAVNLGYKSHMTKIAALFCTIADNLSDLSEDEEEDNDDYQGD